MTSKHLNPKPIICVQNIFPKQTKQAPSSPSINGKGTRVKAALSKLDKIAGCLQRDTCSSRTAKSLAKGPKLSQCYWKEQTGVGTRPMQA